MKIKPDVGYAEPRTYVFNGKVWECADPAPPPREPGLPYYIAADGDLVLDKTEWRVIP